MILQKNIQERIGLQTVGILMEFLHLGIAAGTIYMFDKNKTSELAINYRGSLSPKDPIFPAWWDKLKSEWK